jgi:glutathione peroxidase
MNTYDFSALTIDGIDLPLSTYRGHPLLIVNVASKCGFTPQYAGLEALYKRFHEQGLQVLGFPCDQFGHQEPGDEADIKNFCSLNYGVSFPMFAKIKVNGPDANPLYEYLKDALPGIRHGGDQMEFHQVSDRQGRGADQALCARREAGKNRA